MKVTSDLDKKFHDGNGIWVRADLNGSKVKNRGELETENADNYQEYGHKNKKEIGQLVQRNVGSKDFF